MEYEQMMTLATVRGLGRCGWDALGQFLLLEVKLGKPGGPLDTVPVTLIPEVVEELFGLLGIALAEREREEPSRQ